MSRSNYERVDMFCEKRRKNKNTVSVKYEK